MKTYANRLLSLLLCCVMLCSQLPALAFAEDTEELSELVETEDQLLLVQNDAPSEGPPSGGPGGSGGDDDTEPEVSYNYIEFGTYPQTEIVSQASDSGVYDKAWAADGDYIVDAELYNTLTGLSDDRWDSNGDTTVEGSKYRRIKKGNATGKKFYDTIKNDDGSSSNDYSGYYNWSSDDTYHYFKYEPIKWRILQQSESEAFLLSETALDCQEYNTELNGNVKWENSSVRSWLNDSDSSVSFINTAFSSEEQSRIITATLSNKVNIEETSDETTENESGETTEEESGESTEEEIEDSEVVIVADKDTNDRIFLLADDDVYGDSATAYGFASNSKKNTATRQAKSSTYAKAMGTVNNEAGNCDWWIRSPGSHKGLFILVMGSGYVYVGGQHANSKTRGVRPAMYISLPSGDDNEVNIGDVNMDKSIDIMDCNIIRRSAVGLTELSSRQKTLADVNGDGAVNVIDANYVRRYIVKLISSFPAQTVV